ncbi:PREDICTED: proline-rich protein 4 isoform X2 [Colobus angolensis palliatus]|uniref:proline-rich protein 4 isoform X2 n=1 Tax=Colobus angolensis palliatus TaxID=336983 RepID=UPI0005F52F7B|nr:PREDICTED: proline-rich protein 4 isoform X2 [Colobus angolensis palliatus]
MLLVLLSVVLLALSSAQSTDNDVISEDFTPTTPGWRKYQHSSRGTDRQDISRTSHPGGNLEFNDRYDSSSFSIKCPNCYCSQTSLCSQINWKYVEIT